MADEKQHQKEKEKSYNVYDLIRESSDKGVSLEKVVKATAKDGSGLFGGLRLRRKLTKMVYIEYINIVGSLESLEANTPEYRIAVENAEILSNCYEKLNRTWHEVVVAIIKGIFGGLGVVLGIGLTSHLENKGIGFVGKSPLFWQKPKMD